MELEHDCCAYSQQQFRVQIALRNFHHVNWWRAKLVLCYACRGLKTRRWNWGCHALVLSKYLRDMANDGSNIIGDRIVLELGSGTGVCGFICTALQPLRMILTDREIDLLERNCRPDMAGVSCHALEWGDDVALSRIVAETGVPSVVLGAEVACLRKQQTSLMMTLESIISRQRSRKPESDIFEKSDGTTFYFSFDGLERDSGMAEKEMRERVITMGITDWQTVATGRVTWTYLSSIEQCMQQVEALIADVERSRNDPDVAHHDDVVKYIQQSIQSELITMTTTATAVSSILQIGTIQMMYSSSEQDEVGEPDGVSLHHVIRFSASASAS